MRPTALAILAILCGVLGLALVAGTAVADTPDAGVLVDAGPGLVDAGIAAAPVASTPLPDPTESPLESGSLLWRLYKGGHLLPAIILALFFALTLAQKWVAWLRVGWRKLLVASVLGGLGMLAESAADGTTPNLMMLMGAFGAAMSMYVNGKGEPTKTETA